MERVTGIGGLFFRARDPDALARWYADHLGIDPAPATYEQPPWWQQQGPTVLSPFPADTDHFGRPEQAWKLNLRVRDLDAMVAQLRAADIEVTPDPQAYPNGRFASTADPEGNPIELWEPTPDALQKPPGFPTDTADPRPTQTG
jgi:glyoxylase I family protein